MTDQGTTKALTIAQELGGKQSQFNAALPAHMPVERFVRVIMTAIQNNPDLAKADRASLWNACMKAAQDGLLPDGREGALVVYPTNTRVKDQSGRWVDNWIDKVVWMPMVAGLRKKVRNSGTITTWDVHAVRARDEFEYELGDDPYIKHKPYMPTHIAQADGEAEQDYVARLKAHMDPGPTIAFYSVAVLKGGEKSRDVMSRADVEYVRDNYSRRSRDGKFSPMWVKSFDEAGKKTLARRHSKVLPMSTDLDDLLRRDDELYDMAGKSDKQITGPKGSVSDRLDELLGGVDSDAPSATKPVSRATVEREDKGSSPHDPDTGEIIEQDSGRLVTAPGAAEGSPDAVAGAGASEADGVNGSRSPPPHSSSPEGHDSSAPAADAQGSPPAENSVAPAEPPQETKKATQGQPMGRQSASRKLPEPAKAVDRAALLTDLTATGEKMADKGLLVFEHWLDNELTGDEQAILPNPLVRQWLARARAADKAGK